MNWYYAKNSYYFSIEAVCAFGEPERDKFVYVVPEGFDLRRQRIRNLEFRKAKYGEEDTEKQIAREKERTVRIASAALWDDPI